MEGNRIVWYLTRLEPGEKRTFQVTCQALFTVNRACTDVLARTADGLQRTDQKCLPILPGADSRAPGAASPALPPAREPQPGANPLPNGGAASPRGASPLPGFSLPPSSAPPRSLDTQADGSGALELTIDTRGDTWRVGDQIDYLLAIRNNRSVVDSNVVLTVNLSGQVQLVNYSGPVNAGEHSEDWRSIRMIPIQTLRPGETVRFTVSVRVARPGQLVMRADARSALSPEGVAREDVSVAET
jgi:hypothetical protein